MIGKSFFNADSPGIGCSKPTGEGEPRSIVHGLRGGRRSRVSNLGGHEAEKRLKKTEEQIPRGPAVRDLLMTKNEALVRHHGNGQEVQLVRRGLKSARHGNNQGTCTAQVKLRRFKTGSKASFSASAPGKAVPLQNPRFVYHRCVSRPQVKSHVAPAGPWAWIRETFRTRGVLGGLTFYFGGLVEMLRDLTPGRRRSRYGDIDYDFDHGVDTTWATISLRTRFRELLSGGQYQPSDPELFHQILRALPVAPDGFTFIDLGSGKGRTLLMASDFPFRRILGVELLDEFETIARRNIERYRGERQECFALESQQGDAREFVFPDEPTVLYLFNPFPEHVLREVLANLLDSLSRSPRPVVVIYHNLVFERVFVESEWLQAEYRTPQFAIYRAVASVSG